ncbi:hypothetical protein PTKIN_Ptkin14bG0116100 [Pterospermum kingtungense]
MGNTTGFLLALMVAVLLPNCMVALSVKTKTNISTDQLALLALKAHVISDPANVWATNWSTATSVCNWNGVTCSSRHQRVRALNLFGMNLSGTIPPHLGNMSFLSWLNLGNNSFYGSLPIELAKLRRLKSIHLENNDFEGEIPSWFGSFTELQSLSLSGNNFIGVIPSSLCSLSKLEVLNLYLNNLKGQIPVAIGNLSSLRLLYLHYNQLSGSIPSSIFSIPSLIDILLGHNRLTGSLPSIHLNTSSQLERIELISNNLTGYIPVNMFDYLSKLKGLYLSENQLSGRIPMSLFKCQELEELSLSVNYLEGIVPGEIGNLTMLKVLYLGLNNLGGKIPAQIGNLLSLEELSLQNCHLTGAIPSNIGNLTSLKILYLDDNDLTGQIPFQFGNLAKLEGLYLGNNSISGVIPPAIFNISTLRFIGLYQNSISGDLPSTTGLYLPKLEILELGDNELTGSLPAFITNSSRLTLLGFESNSFSGYIPTDLGNLRDLQWFNVEENNLSTTPSSSELTFLSSLTNCRDLTFLGFDSNPLISGKLPVSIGNLSIQDFVAHGCNIRGNIPAEIGNLSNLIRLNLENNELSGSIPTTIGRLRNLQSLSLQGNKLEGHLSTELCNLKSLSFLNVTGNKFTGPIPTCLGEISNSIGDLKDLMHLSLSGNSLQGSIPESLGGLIGLQVLDLSRNNLLHGEIPDKGPVANYTIRSFMGNEALCAAPRLQLPLPPCKANSLGKHSSKAVKLEYILLPIGSTIVIIALVLFFSRRRRKRNANLPTNQQALAEWRRVSYQELYHATSGFSDSKLLGVGSFGSVFQGTLSDGLSIAVKVFNLELEGAFKSFDIECEVLRNIRHRNLVKIISSCCNIDFKALILEFMPSGSLEKWLYSHNHFLDILHRLNIMIDVASALEYLHHGYMTPVIHCDLKPSNVLLDEDMVAHLGDFGIAKLLGEEDSTIQTMTLASGNEFGSEGIVSTKSNVYSFGILLMETFTRKKPTDEVFSGEMSIKYWVKQSLHSALTEVVDLNLLNNAERSYSATRDCASTILQLALECSEEIPEERIDMKQAVAKLKKIKIKFLKESNRNRRAS